MENQLGLQLYLSQQFSEPSFEGSTFYCVNSEKLRNELDKQNKPKI